MKATLLPLIFAAHFLGDWIVQTDWQAMNKVHDWRAMAYHVLSYHYLMAVAVAMAYSNAGLSNVWRPLLILFVSLASHAFIDRRWPVRWLLQRTGSAAFAETTWGVLAADQALHLSILCLLVAAVGLD